MTTMQNRSVFNDKRIDKRRLQIEEDFVRSNTCSIHKTSGHSSAIKGAYRFFSNDKVTEEALMGDLIESCSREVEGRDVIAFCDTSSFNFDTHKGRIKDTEGLGSIGSVNGKNPLGVLVHPILVHDQESGSTLGISYVKFMTRSNEAKRPKSKRYETQGIPIEEKESYKWIDPCLKSKEGGLSTAKGITFVGDRESDIMEVYDRLVDNRTNVVIRVMHNRNVSTPDGRDEKLYTFMSGQEVKCLTQLEIRGGKRKKRRAQVEIKFATCKLNWPEKQKVNYKVHPEGIEVTAIEVKERVHEGYKDEPPLIWRIITTKKVETIEQAREQIGIYAQRWRVEEFFKLLKSDGYDIESTELTTGKAIRKLILMLMKASIKVQKLKSARSGDTEMKTTEVFEEEEIECLKEVNKKVSGSTVKQQNPHDPQNLAWAVWIIARLGGWSEFYDASRPPGNKTLMWGLEKFEGIMIGYHMSKK
jgi:hypothetical protein